MGIYDREYYREDSRGFQFLPGDWSITQILIAVNVGAFLAQWVVGDSVTQFLEASTNTVLERGQVWRLLTYAFLHDPDQIFHILFNMLFLWMAGREVERIYGRAEFLLFYLAAAVIAGLVWCGFELLMPTGGRDHSLLGASGAVFATLVVMTMFEPNREVLFFFILRMPMWLLVVLFLGFDIFGLLGQMGGREGLTTAFAAHLGGAGYGFLYKHFDLRWSHAAKWALRRPRLKVYRPETPGRRVAPSVGATTRAAASRPTPSSASPMGQYPDEHLDAKVDEILAKIAREGRSGLTDEENRILAEASLRARNKRGGRP